MERKQVIIKKYENRRLYNTANSRYVNLDEVAQIVQDGREVKVLDAATGEDLTRLVLTQIIVEQAKTPGSAFPLDILRQMVAATGRASQEAAVSYMKAMFDMYQNAYRSMPSPLNPFGFVGMPRVSRAADEDAALSGSNSAITTEKDELRRRIEELEATVASLNSAKSAGKTSGRQRRRARSKA